MQGFQDVSAEGFPKLFDVVDFLRSNVATFPVVQIETWAEQRGRSHRLEEVLELIPDCISEKCTKILVASAVETESP
jgi:hypothetical protein